MSLINKLHNNLPGYLLRIPDRLQGTLLKQKNQYQVLRLSSTS